MKKLKKAWKNDFIFPKRFTYKKSPPLPFLAEEDFFNSFYALFAKQCPVGGKTLLGQFSDLHHKGEIIPLRGGDIQISVIVRARIHGDYHRGKAHPHELEIHDEPGRSAVPVLEGVDVHEIRMDAGREFHRMQRTPRRTVPPEKGFHLFEHALRRRRDVPCTGDKHVTPNPRAPLKSYILLVHSSV